MKFDESISFKEYFKLLEARGRGGAKAKSSNYGGGQQDILSPQNVAHAEKTRTKGSSGATPEVGSKANRAAEPKMAQGAIANLTGKKFASGFHPYKKDPLTGERELDDKGNEIPQEVPTAIVPKELVERITSKFGVEKIEDGKLHKVSRVYEKTAKPLMGTTLNFWFANSDASKVLSVRRITDSFSDKRYRRPKFEKEIGLAAILPLRRVITDSDVKEYVNILLEEYQKMNPESVMEINGKKYITSYISTENDFISHEKYATNTPFKNEKVVRKEVVQETNEEKTERLIDFIDGNEEKGIQGNFRFQLIYNLTDDYLMRRYSLSKKQFVNEQFPEFTSHKLNAQGTASQLYGIEGNRGMESGIRVQNTTQGYAKNRGR